MSLHEPSFEIVIDERYLRELHREWIAVHGRGWRVDGVMTLVFAVGGVVGVVSALLASRTRFVPIAVFFIGVALFETLRRVRRHRAWLAHSRQQDWFGRTMTVVLRNGGLVQVKDFEGDPRYERTGAITRTPNGWLVRYVSDAGVEIDLAVSPTLASVYLPLRALRPVLPREEVERLIFR